MKTLLSVGFVFAGFVVFFTEAMISASEGASIVFWLAILFILSGMVVIGCWNLSASAANRYGWIMMVIAGGFCLFASVPRIDGLDTLLKPAFSALFALVGVLGFLKERAGDGEHDHAAAH